jgi:hypothetical protein
LFTFVFFQLDPFVWDTVKCDFDSSSEPFKCRDDQIFYVCFQIGVLLTSYSDESYGYEYLPYSLTILTRYEDPLDSRVIKYYRLIIPQRLPLALYSREQNHNQFISYLEQIGSNKNRPVSIEMHADYGIPIDYNRQYHYHIKKLLEVLESKGSGKIVLYNPSLFEFFLLINVINKPNVVVPNFYSNNRLADEKLTGIAPGLMEFYITSEKCTCLFTLDKEALNNTGSTKDIPSFKSFSFNRNQNESPSSSDFPFLDIFVVNDYLDQDIRDIKILKKNLGLDPELGPIPRDFSTYYPLNPLELKLYIVTWLNPNCILFNSFIDLEIYLSDNGYHSADTRIEGENGKLISESSLNHAYLARTKEALLKGPKFK